MGTPKKNYGWLGRLQKINATIFKKKKINIVKKFITVTNDDIAILKVKKIILARIEFYVKLKKHP